ncbi:MAG: hypothetical protein OXT67_02745 [Zetaproteobacteria bacterium]|nr:hypothetical protein [Zetaproteobacteria bacterium]
MSLRGKNARLQTTAILLSIFCCLTTRCKTANKEAASAGSGSQQSVGGNLTGDDNSKSVRVPVPQELSNLKPETPTQAAVAPPKKSTQSFALDRPQTSKGVEAIITKCFNRDSKFIAENWFFYAVLYLDGAPVQESFWADVNGCNEMQLDLKILDKTKTYEVVASFFWEDPEGDKTIVWYEGSTGAFQPSDQSIPLVLEKLRIDQKVNVDVQKSPKDICINKLFLWNGQRCLDTEHSLVFAHADLSDYAQQAGESEDARRRKCLDLAQGGIGVQNDCNYRATQNYGLKLHSAVDVVAQNFPQENATYRYSWFMIQLQDKKNCLQVANFPSGGAPYLVARPCDKQIPKKDQLFTLIETAEEDKGARESFRILSLADGTRRCLSVPPESGDPTGAAPLRNGANVRLTKCDTDSKYARRSQFIKFVVQSD